MRQLTRTGLRDISRWCHSSPFVGIRCRLYLCASATGPPRAPKQDRVWVRGTTCTRQRAITRRGMVARPSPHVPTGYTSLVTLYEAVGEDVLQVIPCGSAVCYTLLIFRRGCQGKPPNECGMWRHSIILVFFYDAAMSRKTLSSRSLWPVRVSIRQPRLGHACTLLVFKVGNADRANVPPPHRNF